MCSKWLIFRTKKLNFWIKQKLITVSLSFNTKTNKQKNCEPFTVKEKKNVVAKF